MNHATIVEDVGVRGLNDDCGVQVFNRRHVVSDAREHNSAIEQRGNTDSGGGEGGIWQVEQRLRIKLQKLQK